MRQLRDVIVRRRPLAASEATGERPAEPRREHPLELQAEHRFEQNDEVVERAARALAAEMRAPAPQDTPAEEVRAASAEAAAPRAEEPPRRRNIWDTGTPVEAAPRAPEPAPWRQAVPEPAPRAADSWDAPPPEPPRAPSSGGGRVKTRILGFHSEDIALDALSGAAETRSETASFPAGWLVVVDGPGRGASFTLTAGVSTIGRAADQTVCLDFGDASVSRENHASVAYDEEQNRFFIGHGGKRNIVRRNGAPVLATEELSGGDRIRIGKTELMFVAFCGPEFSWTAEGDETGADV